MSNDKKHILVVDDEKAILELVQFNLEQSGIKVSTAKSGDIAIKKARSIKPDAIILDLMLPNINGLDVCRILKSDSDTKDVSIIMLTAKGSEEDIVTGLELGADDYITKPFSPKILVARVNSILRRKKSSVTEDNSKIFYKNMVIDENRRVVKIGEDELSLTYLEFQILFLLSSNPGWVYTRNQIIEFVRGDNYPVTDRSVDYQIVGLRKKLGDYGKFIETIRGVGYKIIDIE